MLYPSAISPILQQADRPCMATHHVDDTFYVSFGDQNVTMARNIIASLCLEDEICSLLNAHVEIYRLSLETGFATLIGKQVILDAIKDDASRSETYTTMCRTFTQDVSDFEQLKAIFEGKIKAIEDDEIPTIQRAVQGVKDILRVTSGRRNAASIEDNPVWQ